MRLLKLVAVLVLLILAGLTGYAYFGDMSSDPREMRMPVELDLGAETPVPAEPASAPAPAPEQAAAETAPQAAGTDAGQDDLD
ncbi:hypothetical protein [Paracoccus binzhouensis]|uniref:hypothetical protein n=1 Tax=Paracoccus binzhouensis TaxID=2796149 RepID=UPI0018EED1CF|nr:hypothetical protein [Paracoccus binzhouensis]